MSTILSNALAIIATKILVAFILVDAHGTRVPARRMWVEEESQRWR